MNSKNKVGWKHAQQFNTENRQLFKKKRLLNAAATVSVVNSDLGPMVKSLIVRTKTKMN